MRLSQWISSIRQLQRPTSSHLCLLNENQPLQTWKIANQVELTGARSVGYDGLNDLFQEKVNKLGGKENILLVGEAGYSPENGADSSGLLEDLSSALFQLPMKETFCKYGRNFTQGPKTCIISSSPSESRMLQFPIILVMFRVPLMMDSTNKTKEILKDIRMRTKEIGSAIVGIVYSWETLEDEKKTESKEQLKNVMSRVFKDQPWGVCYYSRSEPGSIREVKQTITKTMGVPTTDGYQGIEDDGIQLGRSFRELVGQLGGKERFLLIGTICPYAFTSEKAQVFKEITKALFDDDNLKEEDNTMTPETPKKVATECIRLPEPKSFPYPLILVAFRSTFLKEEVNVAQVKEIFADIKARVKMCSTQVVGVICSERPLENTTEQSYQIMLRKILSQTFSCPTAVCSFVRTNLESAEGVKRCVCNVLKRS